jgi:STE24 endopeptidase
MTTHKTDRELLAKEYDTVNNRLFLVQIVVLCGLLALFQFSGASQALADGLVRRFGEGLWFVSNAVYVLVSVFGFAACMTPFSFYSGHVLERHYELTDETTGEWLGDFIKSLGIDLVLAVILFSVIYALLRWIPAWWWLAASVFYILFTVVITGVAPAFIMPFFYELEPLQDGDLTRAIQSMMDEAGIAVSGVFKWVGEEKAETAQAVFAGFGKNKRMILSDTLLSGYTPDEILAVVAREVGHHKNRDTLRLTFTSSVLALVGFYVAHLCLVRLTGVVGVEHIYDIAAAPLFIFSLFIFSLISMPFSNMQSRRLEYAADAYAVEQTGGADALVSAFEKLADQSLSNKEPAPWVEFLLHSHPSLARRIKRVQQS